MHSPAPAWRRTPFLSFPVLLAASFLAQAADPINDVLRQAVEQLA